MRALVVDHEDSFVYNLVQALASKGAEVRCVRYTTPIEEAMRPRPDAVVLSPGPGHPSDLRLSSLSRALLTAAGGSVPILGVCYGHQVIASFYGAKVARAPAPVHGETARVFHDRRGLFRGIRSPFEAARYHSLTVVEDSLPDCLEITARSEDGLLMGLRHRREPTFGVQFHPESFLTREGPRLLSNFLAEARR